MNRVRMSQPCVQESLSALSFPLRSEILGPEDPSKAPVKEPETVPSTPDVEPEPNTIPHRPPVPEPDIGQPCERPDTSCPVHR